MISRKRKDQGDAEDSDIAAMQSTSIPQPEHGEVATTSEKLESGDKQQSKRQRKILAIGGQVGANDKSIGLVQYATDHTLTWWFADENKWVPAVYHQTIRHRLISECSNDGTYDWPRKQGNHIDDKTSFHPAHKSWGSTRANWPKVLFEIERKGPRPDHTVKYWMDDGRVVLDKDNHRVRLFEDLPQTCSSEMEGWEIEAIQRLDPRISYFDILARMPNERLITGTTYQGQFSANALNMRAGRFREKNGLLCWVTRLGTGTKNQFLKALYPKRCLALNYCEDFPVKLSENDLKEMKRQNKGKFDHLRGGKTATPKTGEEHNKKKTATIPPAANRSTKIFRAIAVSTRKRGLDESNCEEASEKSRRKCTRLIRPFVATEMLEPVVTNKHRAVARQDHTADGLHLSLQPPPEHRGTMRSPWEKKTTVASDAVASIGSAVASETASYSPLRIGFHATAGITFDTGTGYDAATPGDSGAIFGRGPEPDFLVDFDLPVTDEELAWLLDKTASDTNDTKEGA
ncbi:hypothetical protein MMC18_006324 [Xylographa bjoerkii]|nr:hypothetical protein [Xylographa bjoerkii]